MKTLIGFLVALILALALALVTQAAGAATITKVVTEYVLNGSPATTMTQTDYQNFRDFSIPLGGHVYRLHCAKVTSRVWDCGVTK